MDQRLPRILGALVALAAVGVVLALVLGGGDDDDDDDAQPQKRAFNVSAVTAVLVPPALEMRIAGEMKGEPIGTGAALITRRIPQAPRPGGEPIPLDLAIQFSQPGGSFEAKFTGTVQVTPTGRELVNGSADVSNGTDRYEGITGSVDLNGRNGPGAGASKFAMKGTVEY